LTIKVVEIDFQPENDMTAYITASIPSCSTYIQQTKNAVLTMPP
jgi:hypothetical protein